MVIGFADLDFLQSPNRFIPSLELMKLSSYYKQKGHIVKVCYDLTKISFYDIIYISKNSNKGDVSPLLLSNSKIKWLGTYFTKGVYQELPKEIELCEPDSSIYEIPSKSITSSFYRRIANKTLDRNNLCIRFTNKGKIINSLRNVSGENIMVYDIDFFKNKEAALEFLNFYKDKKIYFLSEQIIRDFETLKDIYPFYQNFKSYNLFPVTYQPDSISTKLLNEDYFYKVPITIPKKEYSKYLFVREMEILYSFYKKYRVKIFCEKNYNEKEENIYYNILKIFSSTTKNRKSMMESASKEMRKTLTKLQIEYVQLREIFSFVPQGGRNDKWRNWEINWIL